MSTVNASSSSSKVIRKTITTTKSYASPVMDAHGSRIRSPSPARTSRLQEKEELTQLNDRLAAYIDKVRSLEAENSRLSVQISTFEETTQREVDSVKGLYETELADARRLLDDLAKEKARLQIDVGKYKSESEDWMIKYNKKDHELINSQKKLHESESRHAKLDSRLTDALLDVERWQSDYAKLKGEIADLERQLANARKQLEEETLQRVDLENRIQSLKEDLAFKSQLHQTQLNETRTRLEMSVDEVDQRVASEYESRLQEALQEFRKQHEDQSVAYREEVELMYESKISSLRRELERRSAAPDQNMLLELSTYKSKVSDLQSGLSRLSSLNESLEARVKELNSELEHEREMSVASLAAKEKELRQLRDDMDVQTREYQDLLDLKFSLDLELAAYRKLLEGEEQRLSLTPSRSVSRKRRRQDDGGGDGSFIAGTSSSVSEFSTSVQSSGPIEISEVGADGKMIRLQNKTDAEVPIGGWHLVHTAGDKQFTYKFHRTAKADAGGTVTVWSSDSGVEHDPPSHNYVMKEQCWLVNDYMKTVLTDKEENVLASMEKCRTAVEAQEPQIQRTSAALYRSAGDAAGTGEPQPKTDKCSIM